MVNDELKSKITTKTGDCGETTGPSGSRISKCDSFLELIGTLDELQAVIGVASFKVGYTLDADVLMKALNNLMSSIYLSTEEEKMYGNVMTYLDINITHGERTLSFDSGFVLPNEYEDVALAHFIRTVTRRAERRLICYMRSSGLGFPQGLVFLNRLSDYFFYLAEGIRDMRRSLRK